MYVEIKPCIATSKSKNKDGGIIVSDFRIYDRTAVSKAAWYWHRKRHANSSTRTEILQK